MTTKTGDGELKYTKVIRERLRVEHLRSVMRAREHSDSVTRSNLRRVK